MSSQTASSIQIAHAKLLSAPAQIPVSPFYATTSLGSKPRHVLDVFKLRTETYPQYINTPSRDAVEDIGMRLVKDDESIRDAPKLGVLDNVLGRLTNEAAYISKPTLRSTPSLHPLWNALDPSQVPTPQQTSLFSSLELVLPSLHHLPLRFPRVCFLRRMAVLTGILATLVGLQFNPYTRLKPTTQKSAFVRTRRTLRTAPQHLHHLISTLVSLETSSQTSLVYIPLLSSATLPLASDCEAATDGRAQGHAQVNVSANKSLKQLGDPGKTTNALSALLKTSFMRYIEHSSLAHNNERGLRERGAESKKKAAQIVTIPTLLEALRQPGESPGTALQALREVMSVPMATVLPVLLPTLTVTMFNERALASPVTVAGNALSKRITVIWNVFIKVPEEERDRVVCCLGRGVA
ncbi:hypothetical protein OG21DRAFT_1485424 [Imleria badia]|nr:hypothetical protein OG21DRAFT_1485424 [Imleria badia]